MVPETVQNLKLPKILEANVMWFCWNCKLF